MSGCYEYKMKSGVQKDLELKLLRAFCLPKELVKRLVLKWHSTERDMLNLSAVPYKGSYRSGYG